MRNQIAIGASRPASRRWAPTVVGHPSQAQALGDFSQSRQAACTRGSGVLAIG
jgi:hypothetical protein